MADAIEIQILDAFGTKLLTISGIGSRVYDYIRPLSEVEGTPAICFKGLESKVVGEPIASTRRKLWDMEVGIVVYVSGGDVRAKAYELVKQIEIVLEADTTLGVPNVEQCRVVRKVPFNMGPNDPQFGVQGEMEAAALIRFRTTIGAP